MSKRKNKSPNPAKSRTFTMELYPEWDYFNNILAHISKQRYWLIVHDEDENPDGTKKKPHVHVVVEYTGQRTLTSVQNEYKVLQLEDRFVDTCNKRAMIRYLVHKDNPEKHQYPVDKVDTNDPRTLGEMLADQLDENEILHNIMDWIDSQSGKIRQSEYNAYLLKHQYMAVNNRYWNSMLRPMMIEHNEEYRNDDEMKKLATRLAVKMAAHSDNEIEKLLKVADTFGVATSEITKRDGSKNVYTVTKSNQEKIEQEETKKAVKIDLWEGLETEE